MATSPGNGPVQLWNDRAPRSGAETSGPACWRDTESLAEPPRQVTLVREPAGHCDVRQGMALIHQCARPFGSKKVWTIEEPRPACQYAQGLGQAIHRILEIQ
jgi:hypothetical protein